MKLLKLAHPNPHIKPTHGRTLSLSKQIQHYPLGAASTAYKGRTNDPDVISEINRSWTGMSI